MAWPHAHALSRHKEYSLGKYRHTNPTANAAVYTSSQMWQMDTRCCEFQPCTQPLGGIWHGPWRSEASG